MKDGYPEETELIKIKNWKFGSIESYKLFFYYIKSIWKYPEYFQIKRKYIYVSTGGWSGHEDLIEAMQKNKIFWATCWYSSRVGGHYVFRWPRIDWGKK